MKTLKIGIAGTRGMSTLMGFRSCENVEIDAVCDLDEAHLDNMAQTYHIPHKYRVFEDMADSDIDAIVISTPMQCHVPEALYALEAGKHVMSEVTAGVTMDELFWLSEAVERSGKVYMYAENYCYTPEVQLVNELRKRGFFGDPYYAEGMYLHNVTGLCKYPTGKTSWRSYWQLGKRGNFYPTHSAGPVMTWLDDDHIKAISTFSPGARNDFGLRQDAGTTTMCETEKGRMVQIRVDCTSNRPHNMSFYQLQGTKGIYQASAGMNDSAKVAFNCEADPNGSQSWKPLSDYNEYLPERYKIATDQQNKSGHGGGDFFIVSDFIDAIRNEKQPFYNVYRACEWTAIGLLSELSVMNGSRRIELPKFRPEMPQSEQIIKL